MHEGAAIDCIRPVSCSNGFAPWYGCSMRELQLIGLDGGLCIPAVASPEARMQHST